MGYTKKRKHGKKHRKPRAKLPRLTPLAIAKATQGQRLFNYEDRSTGHRSAVNQIFVDAGYLFGGKFDNSIANQAQILAAVGTSALGDSANAEGIKYHISKHNVTHTLRNLMKETAVVTCYVFKNVVDITYQILTTANLTSLPKAFMADLVKGWDIYQTAANVNLAATGTQVIYTQGDEFSKLTTDNLWPSNSIGLKDRWKMVKHATKRMAPGDTWVLPIHLPNTTYDPFEAQQIAGIIGATSYVGAQGYILALANEGRVFVVRVRGEIGVSDADSDVYGWMETNIYHGRKETAQVRKLQTVGNSVYMASVKDTDAADLVTPSLFHYVDATVAVAPAAGGG